MSAITSMKCRTQSVNRFLLENSSTYVAFRESTMSETDFIREIVYRMGCAFCSTSTMCLSPRLIRYSPRSITLRTTHSSASRDHAVRGLAVTKLMRLQCALRRRNLANHEAFFGSNLVLEETIEGRRNNR